jgi:ABC-2 type transport system ATP-binding protein
MKMSVDNGAVIQTRELSKSFGEVNALESLDLEVPKNSVFAFLGPNGAGKTTTIKLLLGLIQLTKGSGTIFGKDIISDSVDIWSRIGYLPQDFRSYDHMSARETLDYTVKFFPQWFFYCISRKPRSGTKLRRLGLSSQNIAFVPETTPTPQLPLYIPRSCEASTNGLN